MSILIRRSERRMLSSLSSIEKIQGPARMHQGGDRLINVCRPKTSTKKGLSISQASCTCPKWAKLLSLCSSGIC